MRKGWKSTTFSDAPVQIIDGDRGKNYPKQTDFTDAGFCVFLNTGNVTESGFNFTSVQFINEAKDDALRKGKLTRDDVVMTTRGTIGNVAYYNANVAFDHMRINSGMVIFRCDQSQLSPLFLYHYLRSPSFHGQVNSLRSGVAQPQLPIRDIKRIELPVPSLAEQSRVAELVANYDNLMENNRRRMELLEEAARQLYREWFVRLRFPGSEHTCIVNGVPEGWKKGRVGDLVSVQSGFAFKSRDWQIEGNSVIKIANIDDNKIEVDNCQCVSDEVAEKASKFLLKEGDFLIAMTGATVGKVGIMPRTNQRYYLNQRVGIFRSRFEFDPTPFLFVFFNTDAAKQQVFNFAQGAAQPNISPGQIESIEILIPSDTLFSTFLEISKLLFQKRLVLLEQNHKLKSARDLLLPRLMSGEIAV